MKKAILCPICLKKSSLAPSNPFRPFCCERCKLIDLGGWASEEYKIPLSSTDPEKEWEENNRDNDKDKED